MVLKWLPSPSSLVYEARCSKVNSLQLTISQSQVTEDWVEQLHGILSDYKEGNCPIALEYTVPSAVGQLNLGKQWLVQPKDELIARLREDFGKNNVSLQYH